MIRDFIEEIGGLPSFILAGIIGGAIMFGMLWILSVAGAAFGFQS